MRRFNTIAVLALSAAITAGLLAGCSGGTKPAAADSNGKTVIRLGGLAPLTGNYAEYGKGFQFGF